MATRIVESEYERRMLLKFIEGHKLPMTARIEAVGKRLRANMKWLSATAQASTPASQAEQAMA